jgi:hypothetical protein
VLAPPDIGLYVNGLSACRAFLSYEVSPGFVERSAEAQGFYEAWLPEERRGFLERERIRFVILPGNTGPNAQEWLGENAGVQARVRVVSAVGIATVYERRTDGEP